MSKLLLIDGHSILNRAFYGVPDLTNSEGIHTNAMYGFLNIMFKFIDEEKPDYVTVAFDLSAPTFRHKVYDGYKDSQGTTYADSIAARPGYSEHQTGLSLDIFSKENTTTSNFKDSPAYNWLTENAHKYGFIQRYQKDTEDITGFKEEAWHWRYVGVDAATYIYEHNITFDEYYAYFILNK